ncbi:MAG TPA: hypothetical protein VMX17_13810 [Candidatus Glassbacteria bacterium]|nr:hypothetical protein [Candidatus Glassbacteria bacterium]
MALPTSGQLSFNQINVELGNASGSQASLRAMSVEAGKTVVNASVSAFYGYSAADDIVVDWANPSTPSVSPTTFVQYYSLIRAGQSAGTTLRPRVSLGLTAVVSGNITWEYSVNSTVSWVFVGSRSTVGSILYYLPTGISTYVGGSDILRLRISISRSASGSVSYSSQTLAAYILGVGTVNSYTASGLTNWAATF